MSGCGSFGTKQRTAANLAPILKAFSQQTDQFLSLKTVIITWRRAMDLFQEPRRLATAGTLHFRLSDEVGRQAVEQCVSARKSGGHQNLIDADATKRRGAEADPRWQLLQVPSGRCTPKYCGANS